MLSTLFLLSQDLRVGAANPQLLVNSSLACVHFGCLLVWSITVCVNKMQRGKDISNCLKEAIVAPHESGKAYKTFNILK